MTLPTVAEACARHAGERPDHPAIVCEDRVLSYRELHRSSNRVARALMETGAGPGTRVAFLGRESEHYYTLAVACAKAGAVLVPANWRLTASEVEHILRDSEAELLFLERDLAGVGEGAAEGLPLLRTVVTVDGEEEDDRGSGLRRWSAEASDDDLAAFAGPDDPVAQIYTSGTTGLPKGVVLAGRSFATLPRAFREAAGEIGEPWIDWLDTDVNLVSLPGFGIAGYGWFMHALHAGATNVVMRMFEASEAVRCIREHGVTTTFAAPAMLAMMLDARDAGPETFASLRKVCYGAAPMTDGLLTRCMSTMRCMLAQIYASTEAGSIAVCLPPSEHVPGNPRLRTVGRACPGNELEIVDSDGRALPPGEIGQVRVRTPARMLGYWNRPEATAEVLDGDRLLMGDAGWLDEDGYLHLCDRIDDTIIVAGQNIYPTEVEAALGAHPDVADVAVVGVPGQRWGDAVHACVVMRPGVRMRPRALLLAAREDIADYKLPTAFHQLETLPRNPAGKVLRRVLVERLSVEPDPAAASDVPQEVPS